VTGIGRSGPRRWKSMSAPGAIGRQLSGTLLPTASCRRSYVLLAVSTNEDADQILHLLPGVNNHIVNR
jgi:hypothetical protein